MTEIALFNSSDADIIEFPISEAVLDKNDMPKIDPDTQQPMTTGDSHVWSLAGGETLVFPKYVAKYLQSIYGFLQEVEIPEGVVVEGDENAEDTSKEEVKVTTGAQTCKYCGQSSANIKGLGMHIAARHPEKLV